MANEVWKEYEANPLTHSAAHYLMTIRGLLQERGYARVTDIAREMNITRGSCSISLKPLKKRGLVAEDDNKFLQLSAEGERLAAIVENNDKVLEAFFRDVLGVDAEQAEIDACKIEHLLSIETSMKIAGFLEFIRGNVTKSAGPFLRAYRRSRPGCEGDASGCRICADVCLVEPKPLKRRRRAGAAAGA